MRLAASSHPARRWVISASFALLLAPARGAATAPPHDAFANGCSDCHMAHSAPGPGLANQALNATLCLSCHASQSNPTVSTWQASDQSTPGTSGSSHRWDANAVRPDLGAASPTGAALQSGLASGTTLQCSTCHDQHSQSLKPFDPTAPSTAGQAGRHFLVTANDTGQMCVDCHAQWNQSSAGTGTYYTGAQATFTNGNTIVSGSGTTWTTQLQAGWRIRRQSDLASAWAVIKSVDSNTQVTLVSGYGGTTGSNQPWVAAKTLTHPVGVALPAASGTIRNPPVETSGTAQVAGFWGTATGGSTTSLIDTGKNFTGAVGLVVRFTSGANRNVTKTITSVSGGNTTVNWSGALGTAIGAGVTYEIDVDGNLTNSVPLAGASGASFTAGNVACLSCHEVHFGDSDSTTYDDRPPSGASDGHLLRRSKTETCDACHPSTMTHSSANTSTKHGTWGASFSCRTCHDPHQTSNVSLVTPSLATPSLGTAAVDFRTSLSGQAAYGQVDSSALVGQQTTGRGPCEACHNDTRNGNEYTTGTVNVSAGGVVTCNSGCSWVASQFVGWEFRVGTDTTDKFTRITANTTTGLTLGSASGNVYAGTKSLTNVAYSIANPRFRGLSAARNNLGSGEGAAGTEHYETNCLQCHPHDKAFAAGESSGGSACDGCHGDIWNRINGNTGTTPSGAAIVSRHTLGTVAATNASPNDANVTWGNPLSANAASVRSCLDMCHDDHPHTAGATTHEYNAYKDSTSQASRAATTRDTATKDKTDFDSAATNGGMCLSCHRNPVDSSHAAVDKTGYAASKHAYTSNTVGASTYTWTYQQHDGGVFQRSCTKCHNDPGDLAPSDTSGPFAAVHFSRYPSLLFGNVTPASAGNTLGGNVCMQCHGDGTTGLDRSGANLAAPLARTSKHPVSADATHDSVAEYAAASAEGTAGGATRHVNCLDCHDPHNAGAAHDSGTITSAGATSLTDSAKSGAWAANQWTGYRVVVQPYATTLAGSGQAAAITGNTTGGQINVASWPAGTPPTGASYAITKMGTGEVSAATSGVWGVTVTPGSSYSVGQATFQDTGSTVHSGASGGIVTTASTGTTVTSNNRLWTANQWAGYVFRAVTGAQAGQTRNITANAASTLTINSAITLAAGDLFVIYAAQGSDTLYFKASAEESPAEPMPNQHQPTSETFAGGTWIGRKMSPTLPTVAYETETVTVNAIGNYRMVTFTSPVAIAAASVPAGNWTVNVYAAENDKNTNAFVRYSVYKWNAADSLGTTVIARTNDATELTPSTTPPGAVRSITVAGAAVSLVAGDKIVVDLEIYANSSTGLTASYYFGAGAVGSVKMPGRVDFGVADPATPAWTSSMIGGYIRNELDRNGRWYRVTNVTQPDVNALYHQATITPAYSSTGASALSNTKMTNSTTAPTAQWQMDHGTLYSISTNTVAKTATATKEHEICLRCHSSYAYGDSPPNVPSGHIDATAVKETNVPHDFGTGQLSYHPVFAQGLNQPNVNYAGWNTNAVYTRIDNSGPLTFGLSNTFTTGWFKESLVRCSDCHTSDTSSDPLGPHGSGKKWLLKGLESNVCWTRRNSTGTAWERVCNSDVPSTPTTEAKNYCLNCHRWDVYGYIGYSGAAGPSVLSRVPHDVTGQSATYGAADLPTSGIVCNQCHGGDRIAGAHGSSRRKYPYRYDPSTNTAGTISVAPQSYSGKRLLNGAYWYGVTRATATTGVACWGKAGTDSLSLCAHSHANDAGSIANYSYEDGADP